MNPSFDSLDFRLDENPSINQSYRTKFEYNQNTTNVAK